MINYLDLTGIKELIKKININYEKKPTILYDNSSGTTGTITLSETSANFNYLEIFYGKSEIGISSVKIQNADGKSVCLIQAQKVNSIEQIISKKLNINGTSISSNSPGCTNLINGSVATVNDENMILIYKIIGYKK